MVQKVICVGVYDYLVLGNVMCLVLCCIFQYVCECYNYECVLFDVQQCLQVVEKFEVVGQFVGGVVYDFNNMLLIILCGVD